MNHSGVPTSSAGTEGHTRRVASARRDGTPRGRRPRARTEAFCTGTGRSRDRLRRREPQAKLKEVAADLRRRLHEPIPVTGAYLRSVVSGHYRYYGVPMNGMALNAFHAAITRLWRRTLQRRSQKGRMPWERMHRYVAHWLPSPRIIHPYPLVRLGVVTQGKSRRW